ncbi:DUF7344 domain-containing protein [Halegenticoccus soli]|uniref:DUF7344 domain-containing protein n=1 Tax=Halegenticoccus soli TaxID=1985678 RepID=UPI000C6DE850|nr:transcriptional regulator [Halegenticoccus soli]
MPHGELKSTPSDERGTEARRALANEGEIFSLLKNDRRRQVVALLADRRETVPISELARVIAELESDEAPSEKLYKSVYVSLQQTHLPRLAQSDVVTYDRSTGTVSPGPDLEDVLVYTRRGARTGWWSKELAIGLVGLAVATGAMLELPLVSGIAMEVWAVVFFSAIICLNLYQIASRKTKPLG